MLQARGSPRPEDRGNRNIRLVSTNEAKVMLFNGVSWSRYSVAIRVPRIYEEVFEDIAKLGMSCKLGYLARIVALDMAYDRVYAELQLSIPYELYLQHRRRFEKPLGNHVAGIDVNSDRVNLAIVDRGGVLRDVLGCLKLRWIRSKSDRRGSRFNRRVSMFKSRLIEDIVLHAPEYGLETYYVDPAYTSKLAENVAGELGLDRHNASAYIIALQYLGLNPKQVIRSLQKSLKVM